MPAKQKSSSNAGTAAVLSFLFNGLGQIYNGQIKKGLCIISISTVSMIILIVGAIILGYCLLSPPLDIKWLILGLALLCLAIIAIAIVGVYNIFDAYKNAK